MDATLARGQVRIGTLFGWRDSGKHGEMSTDEAEGIFRNPPNLIFHGPADFQAMMADSTVRVEGDGASQLRHWKIDAVRSSNVYTFCAASAYSDDQHKAWLESEGYDACYRINSARLFFRAISEQLADAEFLFIAAAEYIREGATNHEVHSRFHPALLKRAGGYDDQLEVRALWKPRDPSAEIGPLVIPASRAGTYCEPYRTI